MIVLKSPQEIQKMRTTNLIVADIIRTMEAAVCDGITTWDLECIAEEEIKKAGAKPAFKGYHESLPVPERFPSCVCLSVNEEVVHGIPNKKRVLKEGDILGIDFGVVYDGFFGDSARTVPVGKVSPEAEKLMRVTEEALFKGIACATKDNRLEDIGHAVQRHVEEHGYSVVRSFVGHGIGRKLHEEPQVPNYGRAGRGMRLAVGMVLAIEPMVNAGTHDVEVLADGWTAVTKDRKLSAHFEHSVAITEDGPFILSKP